MEERVSDGELNMMLRDIEIDEKSGSIVPAEGKRLALDLRDTRKRLAEANKVLRCEVPCGRLHEINDYLINGLDISVVLVQEEGRALIEFAILASGEMRDHD